MLTPKKAPAKTPMINPSTIIFYLRPFLTIIIITICNNNNVVIVWVLFILMF